MYTQQKVRNISLLEPGMSQAEVHEIMGTPAKVEFSGDNKALHYCSTGYGSDEYAVVILTSGKIVSAKNYTVTLRDTGGATGDCSRFVKSVDLQQADFVHEIRFR
jgi:outer membrane protein assembly factor BamE (lipoprotein component of BamABCDE complex)